MRSNYTITKLVSLPRRLAWRLLNDRVGLVRDTLLYALVIYGVGCIVPTPLDAQPATANAPIVLRGANPPFGMLPKHQQTDLIELTVFADDADDDIPGNQNTEHFRLFFQQSDNSLLYDGRSDFPLSTENDPAHPTFLAGNTGQVRFCEGLGNQTIYLFAVVADRAFQTTNDSEVVPGGTSDQSYWVLPCTP